MDGERRQNRKAAFRALGDRDHPDANAHEDARWKWGIEDNYITGKQLDMFVEDPKYRDEITGRTFIQQEDDRYAFVDGDDVVCPETGAVHPAFKAFLAHLGLTYTDISTSDSGSHAQYIGEIPIEGKGQVSFEIGTEPWGANDDVPVIEIYANKHVCLATGKHVPGSPLEANEWDDDVLETILKANGYEDEPEIEHDTDRDTPELENYNPEATHADDEASDVRDVLTAVERLEPRDVPLSTTQTGADSTGWTTWDPSYRRSDSGKSLHYNGEGAFHDFREGEAFGVLSLYAAEQGIISNPWDRLSGSDWWEAVEAAREAGAPIPEFDTGESAEPASTLPLARLDALDAEEWKRYARSHGFDWPSTSKVRDRLKDEILTTVRSRSSTVIDAPTSVGKSYTTATTPWLNHAGTTGEQPVVHLHKTREARDSAAADSSEANVSYRVLKGQKERCPAAAGDHDPNPDGEDPEIVITMDGTPAREWLDAVCEGKGIPFSVAHQYLAENNDQGATLPCEHDDTECQAMTQWDGIPRNDDGYASVDVIHATHAFARVPSLIEGCNVILDEQPDFGADLTQDEIRRSITAYLKAVNVPKTTFEEFVDLATPFEEGFYDLEAVGEKRREMDEALEEEPGMMWYLKNSDAHALAPALAQAVWEALRESEPDCNGRRSATALHEPPRFDDYGEDYLADRVTVVIDDDYTIQTVRVRPWFDAARSVVGLDAHPSMNLWQRNTVPEIGREPLLEPTERQLWRRFERGLTVVQVGDATRPFTSGEYFDEDGTRTVLEHLNAHYGPDFSTCITASSVEGRTKRLMEKAGISDPETMHYGEEKSRNDFGDESVGLVNGCIDPGDDYVLNLLAECGLEAEPATVETEDGEIKREKGRTFSGPDADAASELLASVRENHVAQAAGRYARDADNPDNSAVVLVRTDAIPPELVDIEAPGVEWVYTETQREIVEELRSSTDGAPAKKIADELDCSKRHVLKTLRSLEGATRDEGAGKYGADLYHAGDMPENGEADLRLEDFEDATSTWEIALHDTLVSTIEPATTAEPMKEGPTSDGLAGPPGGGET
ncbi:hypothetical protein [Haloterrigena salifodinae]|uniref:hypothetical protein n=1 Tax=Haloterrigena salifodinae TaxID=2675099 RepID=UPI000F86449D|nr:hypothetical protein [Haloterrigena salifodinae]